MLIGLNKDFRKMLSENAEFKALSLKEIVTAADGTRKVHEIVEFCPCNATLYLGVENCDGYCYVLFENLIIDCENHRRFQILFTLEDGMVIETVVIPSDSRRNTVCVSSQVGCGMNCQFCYTGRQAYFSSASFEYLVLLHLLDCLEEMLVLSLFILQDGSKETSDCC